MEQINAPSPEEASVTVAPCRIHSCISDENLDRIGPLKCNMDRRIALKPRYLTQTPKFCSACKSLQKQQKSCSCLFQSDQLYLLNAELVMVGCILTCPCFVVLVAFCLQVFLGWKASSIQAERASDGESTSWAATAFV